MVPFLKGLLRFGVHLLGLWALMYAFMFLAKLKVLLA